MGIFAKRTPMEKWRKQNSIAARFVDARGWDVDLGTGAVHTVLSGTTVTVLMGIAGVENSRVGVIVEAGAQAERTLRNEIGDDGGEQFEDRGWRGAAAPGSGLVEGSWKDRVDEALFDRIVEAADDLVERISSDRPEN